LLCFGMLGIKGSDTSIFENAITDAQIEKLWELFIRESGIVDRLRVE
jgi:hypothetical protein